MYFQHADDIWRGFPELVPGALHATGITADAEVSVQAERYLAIARGRLDGTTESELPEIQAWRRTFSKMGLKPTQYRCASESLLRRFRKEGALPAIHPLIDLCNAISLAFAVPIAVFDLAHIADGVEVRHATGDERYETFGGDEEHPDPGEVIFADGAGWAHARRWTNRQSGRSAIREGTSEILVVAEAMHATAPDDMPRLMTALAEELGTAWPATTEAIILAASSPRFTF